MAEEKSSLVELAKYPVAILSIFLALVGAKYVLDLPFGSVAEITKDGVKFTQDVKGVIADVVASTSADTPACVPTSPPPRISPPPPPTPA